LKDAYKHYFGTLKKRTSGQSGGGGSASGAPAGEAPSK
jgi:hypothetical protein